MTNPHGIRRARLLLAAGVLGAAAAAGGLAVWGAEHPQVALVTIMALLAPLPFVVRGIQRRWDPFEPINLMAIGIIVLFVARPIAELATHVHPYAPQYDEPLGFTQAMLVGIVGTAALYAGYFWRVGRDLSHRLHPLAHEWDAARSVRFAVGLLAIGAVLTLLWAGQVGASAVLNLVTGRSATEAAIYGASSGYFYMGPYLAIPASFILLVAWTRRRTWGTGLLLVCTIAFVLAITIPNGDRTFTLELLLPLAVLWYLRRHRRPRVLSMVLVLLALALVANVEVGLREKQSRVGRSVPSTVIDALRHPGHELGAFITGADPSGFSVLAIEMHAYETGALRHQPGSTFRSILIGWIPHEFFGNNKPLTPLQYVSWTLFPATKGFRSYLPLMYGSMFADAGWLAVVLLSLGVGVGLRTLWEYCRRNLHAGGVQIVFAGTLPLVVTLLREDIADIFYRSLFLVIPLILCVSVCSRPPRTRALLQRMRGRTDVGTGNEWRGRGAPETPLTFRRTP